MLGDLVIPADSLSISLGIGLSITWWKVNAWVAVGGRSSVVRAPEAKAGGHGFDSQRLPWVFFSLPAGLLNVDEMKDLWCFSTVRLLSTQI